MRIESRRSLPLRWSKADHTLRITILSSWLPFQHAMAEPFSQGSAIACWS